MKSMKLCEFGLMQHVTKYFSRSFVNSTVCCADIEWTGPRFSIEKDREHSTLNARDISFFQDLLGPRRALTDDDVLASHNVDWFRSFKGNSPLLLKPKTTKEVSNIISYCNTRRLPICVQGGNTGVVGGATPVYDEIILSTMLMNEIEEIDKISGTVTLGAGCVLESVDQALNNVNLMVPLDLASKGSCYIGGNVATNAGGIRVLRYGSLHGSVLGLEAVLPSGQILDLLSSMRKDNTGIDLKHLFIGSEGTLGVITKVSIQCIPRPKSKIVAFLGVDSFEGCVKIYKEAKEKLSEILSACEFADHVAIKAVQDNIKLKSPLTEYPFYVLIETLGSNMEHDEDKMNVFLSEVMSSGLALDGTLATDSKKVDAIWRLREDMAEAMLKDGFMYTYDVSLPLPVCYDVVARMQKKLSGLVCRCSGFGHLGDGNIHLTASSKVYNKEVEEIIVPFLYEEVQKHKGSISAEHGLGVNKRQYMHYSKSKEAIQLMRQLKSVIDPQNILNPYKVFP